MTQMLVLAYSVLVLAVVLGLLVALGLVVVLELSVALKKKNLVQQQGIHLQGNCVVLFRKETHSVFPFSFETFRARSWSAEQLADVVALCPNTSA